MQGRSCFDADSRAIGDKVMEWQGIYQLFGVSRVGMDYGGRNA